MDESPPQLIPEPVARRIQFDEAAVREPYPVALFSPLRHRRARPADDLEMSYHTVGKKAQTRVAALYEKLRTDGFLEKQTINPGQFNQVRMEKKDLLNLLKFAVSESRTRKGADPPNVDDLLVFAMANPTVFAYTGTLFRIGGGKYAKQANLKVKKAKKNTSTW